MSSLKRYEAECSQGASRLADVNDRLEAVLEWESIGESLGDRSRGCWAQATDAYGWGVNTRARVLKDYEESEIDRLPHSFADFSAEVDRSREVIQQARQYF